MVSYLIVLSFCNGGRVINEGKSMVRRKGKEDDEEDKHKGKKGDGKKRKIIKDNI